MKRFTLLSMRNFMGYGNNTTIVNLDRTGTTLIRGEDLDNTNNGTTANGVGKTTILRALMYVGYNQTLSDMTVDELVNDVNKKEMEVSAEWIDDDTNTRYKAIRYRKMKHGSGVKFYVNDVDKTVAKGTDQLIEDAIGMPFDIFVRIAIFSASYKPFLSMPTSSTTGPSQRSIIEELFGLTELTTKSDRYKAAIKQLEADLKLKSATTSQAQREVERHKAQIQSAKQRIVQWYDETDLEIAKIAAKLKKTQGIDLVGQQALHDQRAELRLQLAPVRTEYQDLQRLNQTAGAQLVKLQGELKHLTGDTCPYCSQEFKGAAAKVEHINAEVGAIELNIQTLSAEIAAKKKTVDTLTTELDHISSLITVENVAELVRTQADADNMKQKMLEMGEAPNPHEAALAELEAQVIPPVDTSEVERLERRIEHAKFLVKLLTKPDSFVRKKLLANNLPYLNQRLKVSLHELGLPYQIEFQSDMTAILKSTRGQVRSFAQLSTGQAARVNLALAFAFADVRYRKHGKINICLLDEVLDTGLDPVGVQLAAKLIKMRARESGIGHFIITHREEATSMFDKKLTVQMSQGFSSIVDESMMS